MLSMSDENLFDRIGGRPKLMELLRHFYADLRQHHLLGPVFNSQIDDWPEHLEKIGDFWSAITGGPSSYRGTMAARHVPLGLKEEHLEAWLGLWEHNCRVWLLEEYAVKLIFIARQIGARLRLAARIPIPETEKSLLGRFAL
jgi:hemoglobin